MIPVTSTSVATNGAEEAAGSNFILFKISGNILPIRLPHKTIPIREKKMVAPTNFQ
jgi:hypothetical protein